MASLTLRGNTWHLLWRWRGKLKSRSTKILHDGKFRDGKPIPPTAAKRELRKLENSLDQGRSYETKTLTQLLDLVQKDYEVSGFDSLPSLKSRLVHIREWFGNLRADRINDTDLLEYADFRRKQSAANKTVKLEFEVILKALRMGLLEALAPPSPRTDSAVSTPVISMLATKMPTLTPFVFARTIKKTGAVRRMTDFRKAWATACRKAGCPGMLFHDLRRSAARNLELAGWPRTLIMQWMGHQSESMYLRYRLLGAAERELIASKIEQMKAKHG